MGREKVNNFEWLFPFFFGRGPQVILFDGNGILHPRGLGLASHFGVLAGVPTIGVAKNLYQMGCVVRDSQHAERSRSLEQAGSWFPIRDETGKILAAVRQLCYWILLSLIICPVTALNAPI